MEKVHEQTGCAFQGKKPAARGDAAGCGDAAVTGELAAGVGPRGGAGDTAVAGDGCGRSTATCGFREPPLCAAAATRSPPRNCRSRKGRVQSLPQAGHKPGRIWDAADAVVERWFRLPA